MSFELEWMPDESLSDEDAEDAIRDLLNQARALAAKRRWYAVTEGVDDILRAMSEV